MKKKGQQKIYIYICMCIYLLVNRSFSNLDNYCTADSIKRRCTKLLCKCAYYVGVPWYGRYAFHITVSKCQAAALRTPPPRWDLSYLIQPMQVMTCCQDGRFMTKMRAPPFTKAGFFFFKWTRAPLIYRRSIKQIVRGRWTDTERRSFGSLNVFVPWQLLSRLMSK